MDVEHFWRCRDHVDLLLIVRSSCRSREQELNSSERVALEIAAAQFVAVYER